MKKRYLPETEIELSPIVLGCMRLTKLTKYQATKYIESVADLGINFFDHADIYDGGKCEELFGAALKSSSLKREDLFIQTKCGIVPGKMYDLSAKHIIESVEGSLKRLHTDYIDSLLLHRPDALVEPEEVADAFNQLATAGKVRFFGVSNHNPMQIELLKKYVCQPLMINQLQFGPAHSAMIAQGLEVKMDTAGAVNRDGSVVEYCRANDILMQAWSPFQRGFIAGPFFDDPAYANLTATLEKLGQAQGCTATTMAAAWILRHPANFQVITGTMNLQHLQEIAAATQVNLSRSQWYEIYTSAGNLLP